MRVIVIPYSSSSDSRLFCPHIKTHMSAPPPPLVNVSKHGATVSGLVNVGNTCYINSVLQVLAHTLPLSVFLSRPDTEHKYRRDHRPFNFNILEEWHDLLQIMKGGSRTVRPSRMVNAIRILAVRANSELRHEGHPHDVSELIGFLIDEFHASVSRKQAYAPPSIVSPSPAERAVHEATVKLHAETGYSELLDIFYSTIVHTSTKSDRPDKVSGVGVEFVSTIFLSIPPEQTFVTLCDCIDRYVAPEVIEGVQSDVDEGALVECRKTTGFWALPHVLVFCLVRANTSHTNLSKNQTKIQFPDVLDMTKHVVSPLRPQDPRSRYRMYGMCNHHGTIRGGHYTATVCTKTGEWWDINDTMPRSIGGVAPQSQAAYCVMYVRDEKGAR